MVVVLVKIVVEMDGLVEGKPINIPKGVGRLTRHSKPEMQPQDEHR